LYKYLIFGLIITMINLFQFIIFQDWNLILKTTSIAAITPLIISGIFIGAFVDGDRLRGNFHSETKEDRERNRKWASKLFLIGFPNIVMLVVLLILNN
jgi:amino acid transporter